MPEFDPDAYLATSAPKADAGSFDPDAYLGTKQTSAPSEKIPLAQSIPGDVNATMPEAYQNPNVGLGASLAKAAQNVPGSALQFGQNMVQPFVHPIDTAVGLKNLGLGILEKTGMVSGGEHEKYADAVGRFFADRYGGLENAQRTFEQDPVGIAGDLLMVLTSGGGLAARAPGIVGKAGEVAGAAGRMVDPLRPALALGENVANAAGNTAAHVTGLMTGTGAQPLQTAAKAGYEGGAGAQAFRENLTGAAPLEEVVHDARNAVSQMRIERGNAYRQQMGPIKADSTVLDFNKIDQSVASAQGVKTFSGRSGTGPAQSLSPKTEGIRKEMTDTIEGWKNLDPAEFHTPEGIDALKQKLGDIRDATQYATPERVAAERIYNAVRQTIVDQVPEYAKVMKGYETASKQIKEIESVLTGKPDAKIEPALRTLQSALRDNVNTSFGQRAVLANYLANAGAPRLMEKLAGQALHAWTPRGLSRWVAGADIPAAAGAFFAGAPAAGTAALATLPMMSPRLMGNAAYGLGAARRYAAGLRPALAPARQIGQISGATAPFGAGPSNPYAPQ